MATTNELTPVYSSPITHFTSPAIKSNPDFVHCKSCVLALPSHLLHLLSPNNFLCSKCRFATIFFQASPPVFRLLLCSSIPLDSVRVYFQEIEGCVSVDDTTSLIAQRYTLLKAEIPNITLGVQTLRLSRLALPVKTHLLIFCSTCHSFHSSSLITNHPSPIPR